jgi:hypothetical protein
MIEILKAFNPLFLVILGSFASILGGIFQFRISDKSRKITLLSSKLERAYELCQLIYDGHKREIGNARIFLPQNPAKYIENRRHPGKEMSELKMLVRAYIPELKNHLNILDSGHKPLKDSFSKIDSAATKNKFGTKRDFTIMHADADSKNWDSNLVLLSQGSFDLKKALEAKMSSLV